ncbi:unnamed protein product, partial [Timema podura]|nr:unnamed protein product [Timema podura]
MQPLKQSKGGRGWGPVLVGTPPLEGRLPSPSSKNYLTWTGCEILRGTMSNWNFESPDGMDKNKTTLENRERFTKLDSNLTFIPSLDDKKPEEKSLSKKPIPYFKLVSTKH